MYLMSKMRANPARTVRTFVLMIVCFVVGMSIAIIGPTLLDLQRQTSTNLKEISLVFNAKSAGGIVGALLSESFLFVTEGETNQRKIVWLIFNRMDYMLAMTVQAVLLSIVSFGMGVASSLTHLFLLFTVLGACFGFGEASLQVYLMRLWGQEATRVLQLAMFVLGIGTLTSPLLCAPFLLEEAPVVTHGQSSNLTYKVTSYSRQTLLVYPYSLIGFLHLFDAVLLLVTYKMFPLTPGPEADQTTDDETSGDREPRDTLTDKSTNANKQRWRLLVIGLQVLFVHLYFGIEIAFGSFLLTFVVKSDLHLKKRVGTQLTSFFWATFTFSKLGSIFLTSSMGPGAIILIGLTLVGMGNAILLFVHVEREIVLWVGTGVIATGMSSLYTCSISYMESCFRVTPIVGVLNGLAFTAGDLTFPFLIAFVLEKDVESFITLVAGISAALIVVYPIVMIICKWKLSARETSDHSEK